MSSVLLSFIPRALRSVRVVPTAERVTIEAMLRPTVAECPCCQIPFQRIHSVYRRVLRDLLWQGHPVTIRIAVRRFRCANRYCARQTFAERLTDVAGRFGRKTGRLRDLHHYLGLALGGQAGARLAARLAIPTSPDTLLRLVRAQSAPRVAATPRVLGIDDWAWRRGHRYGTVLVDLEKNEVVDMLPDRDAAAVATWLRNHPGVEIVARDRVEEVARLHALGVSISHIAAELGAERKTVRRWLQLGHAPLWKHPARVTMLHPFIGYCSGAGVRVVATALNYGANFANSASRGVRVLCGTEPANDRQA